MKNYRNAYRTHWDHAHNFHFNIVLKLLKELEGDLYRAPA
jgi:hypothetical protein